MKKLSVIILSYNTRAILADCLSSLSKVKNELDFEVVVVDNGSSDGSPGMVKDKYGWVRLIENKKNVGFSAGNNRAKGVVAGEYILFLNSDTKVYANTLKETVRYLDENGDVGALSCKIVLPSGELDKDARRAFPTPWVSLTHLTGLDNIFPKSKIFAKYWYGYLDHNKIMEVDALQGAFFLTRRKILDKVGWFDEDYFLNGEDIDLSWKIRKAGWRIIYYPKVTILHIKKGTKRVKNLKNTLAGVEAMELFYKKRMQKLYPFYINLPVYLGILILKITRTLNYYITH